uniref:Capsid protein n=1 Tax=Alphatorquevirus homin13 TaxID=3048415 RepID=A0AAU7ST29_9VIRU
MAYWGWWRRRWFRPRRRRWRTWRTRRRRRVPRRRPRRAVRRYRKRRVRRRRWRGRRYTRRGRLRLRRRRKRRGKIYLAQWNPQTVRRCRIRGMMPFIWAGAGTGGRNYAVRSDDTVIKGGFGGSFGTETFSLRVLFDQYTRGMNRWSYSNQDLDLALYHGCTFTFYRHKITDFIVYFTNNPPLKTNQHTAPLTHPGMLMRSKFKVLIPSFATRPKGRKTVKIKIRPPKLFQHKWYAQSDLCAVPLVQLNLTAADFQHPFGSPLTDTPCVQFQVLGDLYNKVLNIDLPQLSGNGTEATFLTNTGQQTNIKDLEKLYTELFLSKNSGHYWQTFLTNPMVKAHIDADKAKPSYYNQTDTSQQANDKPFPTKPTATDFPSWQKKFIDRRDSLFLFATYHPKDIADTIKTMRDNNFALCTGPNDKYGDYTSQYSRSTHLLDYYLGIYSPIFLNPGRSNIEFFTAFKDIAYNPLLDKGEGNLIWFQYHTKTDNIFSKPSCKWEIENYPLWAACHGYVDYLETQVKYGDLKLEGKVLIRCPYTTPPLVDKKEPNAGFVVYNATFGMGKWIDGSGYIPLHERGRWYVMLRYQTDVFHDIATSGPWAYRDDEKNSQLVGKYKFNFTWGGNTIHSQIIRNPCKDDQLAHPSRQPRDVQVVDPQLVGPPWVLHSFDQRRGFFNETAIRRLLQQPMPSPDVTPGHKRPLLFIPPVFQDPAGAESDSGSPAKKSRVWQEESSIQTGSQPSEDQKETTRELLQRKLTEQKLIHQQLRHLAVQLAKTQAGIHINPLLLSSPLQTR